MRVYILLLLLCTTAVLGQIELAKIVEPGYELGDEITVTYEVKNTYNQEVDLIFTDRTVINETGFEIECLALKLPPESEGVLDLAEADLDISAVASEVGEFTLEPATLTFKIPGMDYIETVQSDPVTIEIKDSDKSSIDKGVKHYNLCEEDQQKQQQQQQQQKQQQPSREEMEQQKQDQEQQQQQRQEQMQEQYEKQSDIQKKLEQTQQNMHQDSSATREALQKEQQRRQEQKERFQENLEKNEEFREQMEEMQQQGFEVQNKSINARGNNSGEFNYQMKNKETGETADIKGSMQDNEMQSMTNTQDIKEDKGYQELKEQLEKQGFRQTGEPKANEKGFNQNFENPKTGEHANIEGRMENDEVKDAKSSFENKEMLDKILNNPSHNNQMLNQALQHQYNGSVPAEDFTFEKRPGESPAMMQDSNQSVLRSPVKYNQTTGELLEEPDLSQDRDWWWLIAPVLIAASALLLLKLRKQRQPEQQIVEKKIDYKKESKAMLEEAIRLYDDGQKKDAYGLAGAAIRFYYSHRLGIKKELSNAKLIFYLKKNKVKTAEIKRCLDLCGIVEFAKYKPNRKDFDRIISLARKVIG